VQELEVRRRGFLQVNNDCLGLGIFASIKFQTSGINLPWNLDKQMEWEMVIFSSRSESELRRYRYWLEARSWWLVFQSHLTIFRACFYQLHAFTSILLARRRQVSVVFKSATRRSQLPPIFCVVLSPCPSFSPFLAFRTVTLSVTINVKTGCK